MTVDKKTTSTAEVCLSVFCGLKIPPQISPNGVEANSGHRNVWSRQS